MKSLRTIALFGMVLISGCGDGSSDPATPPAAPTALTIMLMTNKPHLTWTDNSTNEDGFVIERKIGAGAYMEVFTETFDIEQFHDSGAAAATTYTYRVSAMNDAGRTASNEVDITVP